MGSYSLDPRYELLERHISLGVIARRAAGYGVVGRVPKRVIETIEAVPGEAPVPGRLADFAGRRPAVDTGLLSQGIKFGLSQFPDDASDPRSDTVSRLNEPTCILTWRNRRSIPWPRPRTRSTTAAAFCRSFLQIVAFDNTEFSAVAAAVPCCKVPIVPGTIEDQKTSESLSDAVDTGRHQLLLTEPLRREGAGPRGRPFGAGSYSAPSPRGV